MVRALAVPAAGDPPVHVRDSVDVTFPDAEGSAICGVPLTLNVNGSFHDILFLDDEGNVERVVATVKQRLTWTNTDTGASIKTGPVGATAHVDIGAAPDGRDIVVLTGLSGHIVVPGVGAIAADAGRLVLHVGEDDVEVISMTGLFEGMGGPFPIACDQLT